MTSVPQYLAVLRAAQNKVAKRMGVDFSTADKGTRVLVESNLAMTAVVVKALVDHGVITDQELLATVAALRATPYPNEPVEPAGWPDAAVAGPTTAQADGGAHDAGTVDG